MQKCCQLAGPLVRASVALHTQRLGVASEPAVQTNRRTCLQQLAALSAAALVAPAHAAIVDEDAARRVFDSAG